MVNAIVMARFLHRSRCGKKGHGRYAAVGEHQVGALTKPTGRFTISR